MLKISTVKKETVLVEDVESKVWFLPVIRRFFTKTYHTQGGVYIEKHCTGYKPTYCSSTIKWLEKLKIVTTSQKRADKLAYKYFHKKYPKYGIYVQLF
jgi:hypothetical protein